MTATDASVCARCGAPFACGRDDPDGCWCARLPPLPRGRYDEKAGCLCADCLRRLLEEQPRRSHPE